MKKLIPLLLALCLTLSGCFLGDEPLFPVPTQPSDFDDIPHFSDMVYQRPDMDALEDSMYHAVELAEDEADPDDILDAILAFYDAYDAFYTQYALADIHYSADLTDTHWETEYDFCSQAANTADALLDELYYALADTPSREALEDEDYFGADFFDDYDGESMWDDEFSALMEQESDLISQYYTLSQRQQDALSDDTYYTVGAEMEELYAQLVLLRHQIADYVGYDSYIDFAYDYYYTRDYTSAQAEDYLSDIRQELVPLYRTIEDWYPGSNYCRESETFSYVRSAADAMGGMVDESFELLEAAGLYDIGYGENKYNSSFETYLYSYECPFVFVNPEQTQWDKLTFAHEFGHFANDYMCAGNSPSIDVAEIFSQGMEYLSLCVSENTKTLTRMKMLDSLCIYVEQSAYAAFEHRVYTMPTEDVTAENILALFEEVAADYGLDTWGMDSRDYVTITHFYTNPLYTISYVISNDAAFQLYQMEQENPGSGVKLYKKQLNCGDIPFLTFIEEAGLTSPFTPGRAASIRQTMEEIL
jgi:oligoendopeptidase F